MTLGFRPIPVRASRPTAVVVLLLVAWTLLGSLAMPRARAEPFTQGQTFNQDLMAEVSTAALRFIAPRALDPVQIPELALWGLRGLTTIDPRFTPELRPDELRLIWDTRTIVRREPPDPGDVTGWGIAIAQLSRAAWDGSEKIRRTGTAGIIRTFFDELFNHFDPYSRYAPPDEAAEERARRNGLAGIGVSVATGGVIEAVVAGGPAAEAGIPRGETVVAVDGQPTNDLDAPRIRALLAGPENTPVALVLRRRDRRMHSVTLRRADVPPDTVASSRMGDLLVLRISSFARNTGDRLGRELSRGLAGPRPPRGVVIDLRGNRGGVLTQAVAAAETLLVRGTVATTVGRDPEANHDFVADGQDLAQGRPVVVTVDGRSASSAEILAAALADQGRAVVVGSATLGKGLVQTIASLPDGGDLYVTWSRVLAPLGWPIQGLGVLPQLCTSLGESSVREMLQALNVGRQPFEAALVRERTARAPLSPGEIIEIRNACPAAEGRDLDLDAARFLLSHPTAYATALLHIPH